MKDIDALQKSSNADQEQIEKDRSYYNEKKVLLDKRIKDAKKELEYYSTTPVQLYNYVHMSKEEIDEKVKWAAEILGIEELLDSKPAEMSGGQRQRIALGRAMVRGPKVFLLDEPLSNLDAKLRTAMRAEIVKLHNQLKTTFIYVTHDQTEAMTMGDRIVVMKGGFIQQIDTPQNLYDTPCNKFVAGFLGSPQMNFIDAMLLYREGQYIVQFGSNDTKSTRGVKYEVVLPQSKVTPDLEHYIDKEVTMGIRPENVHDEPQYLANATTGIVKCSVEITELMGAETYLYLTCEGIPITARVSPKSTARPQDEIDVVFDAEKIHLFDKETEKTIIN